jgi:hypothetical protein
MGSQGFAIETTGDSLAMRMVAVCSDESGWSREPPLNE